MALNAKLRHLNSKSQGVSENFRRRKSNGKTIPEEVYKLDMGFKEKESTEGKTSWRLVQ